MENLYTNTNTMLTICKNNLNKVEQLNFLLKMKFNSIEEPNNTKSNLSLYKKKKTNQKHTNYNTDYTKSKTKLSYSFPRSLLPVRELTNHRPLF